MVMDRQPNSGLRLCNGKFVTPGNRSNRNRVRINGVAQTGDLVKESTIRFGRR